MSAEAAEAVLRRLLQRAQAALVRGNGRVATLSMESRRDAGEYLAVRGLEARDAFHGRIALAEREDAITVQRDRYRDDGQRLVRLTVRDASALARHLGTLLLAERVEQATAVLAPWQVAYPVIERVLQVWAEGLHVRGAGPDTAPALADAARVAHDGARAAGRERILRVESTRLFGDSKRLEALTPWLEVLLTGELVAGGLEKEHVWAALGLRREPQPMLIAGSGQLQLEGGELPLLRPWLGVPVEAVRGLSSAPDYVLSIENLASFHLATRAPGAQAGLLLYTGGMPSPAWRRAYACLLRGLPAEAPVLHWGDIDEGGFRIAAVLAAEAAEAGHILRPWRMSPHEVPLDGAGREAPSATVLASMCRQAERAGWPQIAIALREKPLRLEQEALPVALPLARRADTLAAEGAA